MNTSYYEKLVREFEQDKEKVFKRASYVTDECWSKARKAHHFPIYVRLSYTIPHTSREYLIVSFAPSKKVWKTKGTGTCFYRKFKDNKGNGVVRKMYNDLTDAETGYEILTPHFFERYKERAFKDTSRSDEDVLADMTRDIRYEFENTPEMTKRLEKYQYGDQFRNTVFTYATGVGLGYKYKNLDILSTFVSLDMLYDHQKETISSNWNSFYFKIYNKAMLANKVYDSLQNGGQDTRDLELNALTEAFIKSMTIA